MSKANGKNASNLQRRYGNDLSIGGSLPRRRNNKEDMETAKYIANYYLEGEETPQMIRYVAENIYSRI